MGDCYPSGPTSMAAPNRLRRFQRLCPRRSQDGADASQSKLFHAHHSVSDVFACTRLESETLSS